MKELSPFFRAFLFLALGLAGAIYAAAAHAGPPVLMLEMTLDAATGDRLNIERVGQFSDLDECQAQLPSTAPAPPKDGKITVRVCAVPVERVTA